MCYTSTFLVLWLACLRCAGFSCCSAFSLGFPLLSCFNLSSHPVWTCITKDASAALQACIDKNYTSTDWVHLTLVYLGRKALKGHGSSLTYIQKNVYMYLYFRTRGQTCMICLCRYPSTKAEFPVRGHCTEDLQEPGTRCES